MPLPLTFFTLPTQESEAPKKEDSEKQTIDFVLGRLARQYEEAGDFNRYLDGDEAFEIPSPRAAADPYSYGKSELLFWTDRQAYDDERLAWEDAIARERHEESIAYLRDTKQEAILSGLIEALRQQRVVPFVGAGMSAVMGMPIWADALRSLNERINDPRDPGIDTLIDRSRYLEAADALFKTDLTLAKSYVRTTYKVQKIAGPIQLLPSLSHGCVVTTNFDDAIEHAMKAKDISFDGHMYGMEEHNFFSRLTRGERCLLKLHGDYDNSSTYILSGDQYAAAYGEPFSFKKPIPKALRQIYISTTLLFLGCSLETDTTLQLFRQVHDSDEYELPVHYAILPLPEGRKRIHERESFLLGLNIQPI
jgi:hypothetical protein